MQNDALRVPQVPDAVGEDVVGDVVKAARSDHVLHTAKSAFDKRDVRVDNSLTEWLDFFSDPC